MRDRPGSGVISVSRDARPAAVQGLSLRHLTVRNFRNHAELSLSLRGGSVILTGANGSGKTSLLEAVSLLAPGRGLRGARLEELTRIGAGSPWAVHAEIRISGRRHFLGTGLAGEESGSHRRRMVLDDQIVPASATGGCFPVLWATPAMDRLFSGSGSERRRFLDRLVMAFDPQHARRLSAYVHVMRERNRLLAAPGAVDTVLAAALEERMAETGIPVSVARRLMLVRLNEASVPVTGAFSGIVLKPAGDIDDVLDTASALEAEDWLRRALAAQRMRDRESGGAMSGPHRSTFQAFFRNRCDMSAELCSSGEQKALLYGILLAAARLRMARAGCAPLLLLDEAAAHLDRNKRLSLMEEIRGTGAQAWLSGSDPALFREWRTGAQFVRLGQDGPPLSLPLSA